MKAVSPVILKATTRGIQEPTSDAIFGPVGQGFKKKKKTCEMRHAVPSSQKPHSEGPGGDTVPIGIPMMHHSSFAGTGFLQDKHTSCGLYR